MNSFFTRFKEHLNADYGGRYIEVILSEVIQEDISILKILFPQAPIYKWKDKSQIDIDVEEVFQTGNIKKRRADLVVKLFCQFLEENFVIFNEEINEDALLFLLIKGLYLKHAHGFGKQKSEKKLMQFLNCGIL